MQEIKKSLSNATDIFQVFRDIREQAFDFVNMIRCANIKILSMPELLIDPEIRKWVFVPIVLITFFVDTLRQYVGILVSGANNLNLSQVEDSQMLYRACLLRENGKYLPPKSFLMRKEYFNNDKTGLLKQCRPANGQNASVMISEMVKGNLVNMLPMVAIGGWINWMFSGFVTTKVPFPLTLRFKPMLQRGIELVSLDASWVSSASWYFLNVFGLRAVYPLVLGDIDEFPERLKTENEDVFNTAFKIAQNSKLTFKSEWEALQIYVYQNSLKIAYKEFIELIIDEEEGSLS